uniref:(northern house mosquito) hypothetical protein n=1 Tax=Culex pipiens TaxID=7175 RepID=A0A8D8EQJ8_CULPI
MADHEPAPAQHESQQLRPDQHLTTRRDRAGRPLPQPLELPVPRTRTHEADQERPLRQELRRPNQGQHPQHPRHRMHRRTGQTPRHRRRGNPSQSRVQLLRVPPLQTAPRSPIPRHPPHPGQLRH